MSCVATVFVPKHPPFSFFEHRVQSAVLVLHLTCRICFCHLLPSSQAAAATAKDFIMPSGSFQARIAFHRTFESFQLAATDHKITERPPELPHHPSHVRVASENVGIELLSPSRLKPVYPRRRKRPDRASSDGMTASSCVLRLSSRIVLPVRRVSEA